MKSFIASIALLLVATSTTAAVLPRLQEPIASGEVESVEQVPSALTTAQESESVVELQKRAGISASGAVGVNILGASASASGSIGLGIGNNGYGGGYGGYGGGYGGYGGGSYASAGGFGGGAYAGSGYGGGYGGYGGAYGGIGGYGGYGYGMGGMASQYGMRRGLYRR